MKITAQMIADRCGVSRGTVDRVVNGRLGVAPEVQERIQRVIDETGYQTPSMRRQAKAVGIKKIGFVIPNWNNYYTVQMRKGIRAATRRMGDNRLAVVVEELKGRSNREYFECIARLEGQGIEGLVLNAADTLPMQEEIDRLTGKSIPVVTTNSDVPGSQRICHVGQDLNKSGRVAAGLMAPLLEGGSVLIVCGNREFTAHRLQVEGFLNRLRELLGSGTRTTVIECIERCDLAYDGVLEAIRRDSRLRGIYMANEPVPACIDALERAQPQHPVHVICNDLTPWSREYLAARKVRFIIDQDFSGQARRSVELLYDLMFRDRKPARELEYVRTSIISEELL